MRPRYRGLPRTASSRRGRSLDLGVVVAADLGDQPVGEAIDLRAGGDDASAVGQRRLDAVAARDAVTVAEQVLLGDADKPHVHLHVGRDPRITTVAAERPPRLLPPRVASEPPAEA